MSEPGGTVTFLFSDIEGSSRLWERFPVDMGPALVRHDEILRTEIENASGHVFKTVGDAFCAAFSNPASALSAAVEAQRRLFSEDWGATGPLRVRMGLHAGPAEFRNNDYFGGTLNRVARICAAGHGGQILASETLRSMLESDGVDFLALGDFRLRNLNRVERIYQVRVPGLPSHFPPLRSQQNLPHNLPVAPTTFVGRESEIEQIKELLTRSRLLTLLGTGGTGKTRLAIESGREMLEAYPDGVWLVEFATATEPDQVAPAVAGALGVREEPGRDLLESVGEFLQPREMLLIFDNCEHLLDESSRVASRLLATCPKIRILATSRQALRARGETTWPVRPLTSFDVWGRARDRAVTAAEISSFEAVRLFVERARAVQPSFELTDANAPDVARICWRLDGIPLALELAAARLRVLTPAQISERLNDQFRLLKNGAGTVLPHQQTLRALIDWSYDLLEPRERLLFHRLGVFAGGRTLESVEAVCTGGEIESDDVLDLLQQLADKSLIFIEAEDGRDARYTLIESVWQYARERLRESGEFDTLRDRHLDFYLALTESAAPHLNGPDPAGWVHRLRSEFLNLRFALEHAAERAGGAETALRLVVSLERFWEICGNLEDARKAVDAILSRPDASEFPNLLARALLCAARIAWAQDRYADGLALQDRAKPLLEETGDETALGFFHGYRGFLEFSSLDIEEARKSFENALAIGERLQHPKILAIAHAGFGSIAAQEGRLEEALEIKLDTLSRFRAVGDRWIVGYSLWGVAQVALALGQPGRAREALREWAGIARELGNRWSLPYLVQHLADAARLEGKLDLAARLFGAAESLREALAIRLTPSEEVQYHRSISDLRERLPASEYETLWQAGRHLRREAAIELALEG
ncbi:MAG: adenylate/guanylate cyclase domain-containing protein [Terrimicrobiaceae bacterium]|nr:adenylate/guanylate cyclase domain-containing protein [Terrimicrobiaceae bacterium]